MSCHLSGQPIPPGACRVVRAQTIAELDAAARIRWDVFSPVLVYGDLYPALRELSGFDVLPGACVFLAEVDSEPVGTIRLLLPDPTLAAHHGRAPGLPLAFGLRFERLPADAVVAELGRCAVRPTHRGSAVVGHLYRAAYHASRAAGVSHWTGASLTGTDDPADAAILAAMLAAAGHCDLSPCLETDAVSESRYPRRPIFTPEERARAAAGDVSGLRLPRAVAFHLHTGARVNGPPFLDEMLQEYMIPLFFSLDAYAVSPFGRRHSDRRLRAREAEAAAG